MNSGSSKVEIFSSLQGVEIEDDASKMSSFEESLAKSMRRGSFSPDITTVYPSKYRERMLCCCYSYCSPLT